MKHDYHVTAVLILLFILSQVIGLYLLGESMEISCDQIDGGEDCLVTFSDTAIGERPETQGWVSVLYIVIGVGIGTVLLLLIARFGKRLLWRMWFFLAVWVTVAISLRVIIPVKYELLAWIIAFLLAVWKLWWPNIFAYNLSEVLMYSGIAVLLVPIFYVPNQASEFMSVWPMLALLALISLYDMYAVWRSKHMVTMAKFITDSNAFAGLMVPYTIKDKKITSRLPRAASAPHDSSLHPEAKHKNAILGGGDITFPLLFAGVVFQSRVMTAVAEGTAFIDALYASYWSALLISIGATFAIAALFLFAKKDKFYPAMPFVTAGCLLGWGLSLLLI